MSKTFVEFDGDTFKVNGVDFSAQLAAALGRVASSLRTTTGPTDLAIGAWADGQTLVRDGNTARGADADAGGGAFKQATVTVTSAEILALDTTPKVLIAAPAAGELHQVWGVLIRKPASGTAYDDYEFDQARLKMGYQGGSDSIWNFVLAYSVLLGTATGVDYEDDSSKGERPSWGDHGRAFVLFLSHPITNGDGEWIVDVFYSTLAAV